MASLQLTSALGYLTTLAGVTEAHEAGDAELLRQFVRGQDQAAFEELVRRHGRLVWAVCRHVLANEQDCEDAFQAVFLVLARQAGAVRKPEALGSWLHGVAYRVAMKAKRSAARRRVHERQAVPATSTSDSDASWRDLQTALDEEVERLPERLRMPFVLCCLEGRGHADVAEQLGWKLTTLHSRLSQARQALLDRLGKRGVALSAALCAFTLSQESAVAAVPPALAQAAVQTALAASAGVGTGVIPESIACLTKGVTAMFLSRTHLLAFFLALGMLLAAVHVKAFSPLGAQPTNNEPAPAEPEKPKQDAPPAQAVVLKGQVLDPDGKPQAGARVYVWSPDAKKESEVKVETTTSDDGRFTLAVEPVHLTRESRLVAAAKDTAPDWINLAPGMSSKEVTFRLRKDDVPITGRILDLEGRPIQGVTVNVYWVGEPEGRTTPEWIDYFVTTHKKGAWINEGGLRLARPATLGCSPSVITDKEGRFRLTGMGRDRVVTIVLRSETTEAVRFQVVATNGPKEGWVRGKYGLYASGFEFLVGPTKPITGVVRDRKTGKPVAGVLVAEGSYTPQATTDAEGRYRIVGAPKQANYSLSVGGRKGVPYIDHTIHHIPDTPGLDPITLDIEIERGVEITGKVLEKETGKPVRGSVRYGHTRDNTFAKDYITLEGAKFIISKWGETEADGSFTVLGIPGSGTLVVCATESARYPRIDAREELTKLGVNGWPVAPAHLAMKIEVEEKNPKTLVYDLALSPGVSRSGLVTDADGKPVSGVRVVGLTDSTDPRRLADGKFTVAGLQPKRERALVFFSEDGKTGTIAGVDGASDKPITVKLEALGALTGQLVNEEGKPLANHSVLVKLVLDEKKYENLPQEYSNIAGTFNIYSGAWKDFTARTATTDKDGRFTLGGLLPGQRYDFYAAEGDIEKGVPLTHRKQKLEVASGKTTDLGAMKSE
jgi:RNA polymerase sigma factor (sigma-70 family)